MASLEVPGLALKINSECHLYNHCTTFFKDEQGKRGNVKEKVFIDITGEVQVSRKGRERLGMVKNPIPNLGAACSSHAGGTMFTTTFSRTCFSVKKPE